MATDEGAQKAITELHESQLGGRTLTVNEARPKEARGPGGGGGFGGGVAAVAASAATAAAAVAAADAVSRAGSAVKLNGHTRTTRTRKRERERARRRSRRRKRCAAKNQAAPQRDFAARPERRSGHRRHRPGPQPNPWLDDLEDEPAEREEERNKKSGGAHN
jgi:RNA recognition motif-containing protein